MERIAVASASIVACVLAAPHADRIAQLEELKTMPNLSWTPGLNERFASEAPGASAALCGVTGDWRKAIQDRMEKGEIRPFNPGLLNDAEIPEEFDSAKHWPMCEEIIGDIRDQSNCGCCWAFAAAEAASDRMCIATEGKVMVPLSAEDVCFCGSTNGCDGGQIDVPWDYIQQRGAVTGGQYKGTGPFGNGFCSDFSMPHCHHHGPQGKDPYPAEGQPGCLHQFSAKCPSSCDSDASQEHKDFASDKYTYKGNMQTASGESNVQKMILAGGPVETAFTVYSDFENYASGIYYHVTGQAAGAHAVKIVGWGSENGVKYWKVANSWNPHWGESGFFRIRRGTEGIEDQVMGTDHGAKWGRMHDFDDSIVV